MTTTLANEVYNYMAVGKRNSGDTFYFFKDNTPETIRNNWRDFTASYDDYNFSDLDEYYNVLYELVSIMQGYDNFTEDDLYSIDWRDDYNADRLDWLKNNLNRAQYYDDVKGNGAENIFEIIGDMQDMARGNFANAVYFKFLGGK